MNNDAKRLRKTLRTIGLSDPAIEAAWPAWWSEDAEASASARVELRFSLARKLGLDPRSLLDDAEQPKFVWRDEARFKNLATESDSERAAIASFGISVARILVSTLPSYTSLKGIAAGDLRQSILARSPFVRLADLLALCWGLGIPVVHLRVFPLQAKRMCAMAVQVGGRPAILLGKNADYPAPVAYYLAHELGHIALGHIGDNSAMVDLGDLDQLSDAPDQEEIEADRFALELLTGRPEPVIIPTAKHFGAHQLAQHVLAVSNKLRVEPGTLSLCVGHSTKDWATANAALRYIYTSPQPVWAEVNKLALTQLDLENVSDDLVAYLQAVLGGVS